MPTSNEKCILCICLPCLRKFILSFAFQEKLKAELCKLKEDGARVPFVNYHRDGADISFLQNVAASLPNAAELPHLVLLTGGSLMAGVYTIV